MIVLDPITDLEQHIRDILRMRKQYHVMKSFRSTKNGQSLDEANYIEHWKKVVDKRSAYSIQYISYSRKSCSVVGYIYIGNRNDISIMIDQDDVRLGIASEAIRMLIHEIWKTDIESLIAEIDVGNTASFKAFYNAGFSQTGTNENGEIIMEYLNNPDIKKFYRDKFEAHGKTALGLGWESEAGHQIRLAKAASELMDCNSVLDVGRGYGALQAYLPETIKYTGIDNNAILVHACTNSRISFGDMRQLAYRKIYYDAIVLIGALSFIDSAGMTDLFERVLLTYPCKKVVFTAICNSDQEDEPVFDPEWFCALFQFNDNVVSWDYKRIMDNDILYTVIKK